MFGIRRSLERFEFRRESDDVNRNERCEALFMHPQKVLMLKFDRPIVHAPLVVIGSGACRTNCWR